MLKSYLYNYRKKNLQNVQVLVENSRIFGAWKVTNYCDVHVCGNFSDVSVQLDLL